MSRADRVALLQRKGQLEGAAAEVALRISVFATDVAAITALGEIRRELAVIARDLAAGPGAC